MEQSKKISFIGNGSCFNTTFGNNSAYYKKEQTLLLIDCGESIFERLMKLEILENVKDVNILITHMHTDHVGSLASLLFFCEYGKGIVPTVIYPEKNIMSQFLTLVGNEPQAYNVIEPRECKKFNIQEIKQQHSNFINAYGYILELDGKRIYYSGDTKVIPEDIIKDFKENKFDEFYQDVSRYETPAHMNLETLAKLFNENQRSKITCMHFDDEITRTKAECLGFDISKVKQYREIER